MRQQGPRDPHTTAILLLGCLLLSSGCQRTARPVSAGNGPGTQALPDSVAAIRRANEEDMQALLASLGARASAPASEVFENLEIPWLRTVPARTFLSIMNGGYARALGVRCTHCHAEDDFASDEKRPKRAAREMTVMHRMINQELAKMTQIRTPREENRAINCSTCHRGRAIPR
jgi:hypothetical protein